MRIQPFCLESYSFPPGSPDRPCRSWEDRASDVRGSSNQNPRSPPPASMLLSSCNADPLAGPPRIGRVTSSTASRPSCNLPRRRAITASHRWLRRRGQGLPSLQHNSQSQKCLTTTRPGFCLAVPQVMRVDDTLGASWWVSPLSQHMSYSSWLRGPGLIRSSRIITRALPGALPWRICWGSANWTAPAAGLAAETPDYGKDLQCASLPKAFGRTEREISEVLHPLVRRWSLVPAQLLTALPTIERWCWDRSIVLHSEVGIMAADRHIPVWERRIDGDRALQLWWISLCERGHWRRGFFHGDGTRRGRERHNAGRRVYSGSTRAVREVYMNPSISPSLSLLCSSVVRPAASGELLDYS